MSVPPSKVNAGNTDPSANELLSFAKKVSGEDQETGVPNLGTLQLIKLIRQIDTGVVDSWTPIVNKELRHMKAAVKMVTDNPYLQVKFGASMESMLKLVGYIKDRAAEKELEDIIDPTIVSEITPHLLSKTIRTSKAFCSAGSASSSSSSSVTAP